MSHFLKFQITNFRHILITVIRYNFRKINTKDSEKFPKMLILVPKWPIYPFLTITWIALKKHNTVIFTHSLMPVKKYNFRKTWRTDPGISSECWFWAHNSSFSTHFGHNQNFPWKSKTVTFAHSLMPVTKYNFRKI